jgi:prepilin-type N-terminal cleavage/methylation domain-containing protein
MKPSANSGFTLVELVIIIVVMGIVAVIAIPKYQSADADAKKASCREALSNLRSAITIWYANQAVRTGTASWPPYDSLRTIGTVMDRSIPKNPYCRENADPDSIVPAAVSGYNKGDVVGSAGGWVYNESTGEIWPNSRAVGENGW